MTLTEIMEFILLPAVGWLLINSNKNASRLTRMETMLELFLAKKHRHDDDEE